MRMALWSWKAASFPKYGFTVMDDSKTAFITEDQWATAKDRESVDLYFFGYGHNYLVCLKDF